MSSLRTLLGLSKHFELETHLDISQLRQQKFHPVVILPEEYEVFDFSKGYDPQRNLRFPFGIGKYNEHRPTMYEGEQFHYETSLHQRTVHMGIDIAAPVGTKIHAFDDGVIFALGNNNLPFDYGPTLITKHKIQNLDIYALHGHLCVGDLQKWSVGDRVNKGVVIAHVGAKEENGGWNPHLHFQLSRIPPQKYDLPGVVSLVDRDFATSVFPDPRYVLGDLYDDSLGESKEEMK